MFEIKNFLIVRLQRQQTTIIKSMNYKSHPIIPLSASSSLKAIQEEAQTLKLIIIGDCGVGKTNILIRFCDNNFKVNYVATIGVDFKVKSMNVQGKKMKFQIWDTAGQQRYIYIAQTYYKGVAGIILTYSVTDERSFENIQKWMKQINEHAPENVKTILVANKCDLRQQRKVQTLEGKTLADKYNISFLQVSAKTGHNVKDVFDILSKQLIRDYLPNLKKNESSVYRLDFNDPDQYQKNNKKCAC